MEHFGNFIQSGLLGALDWFGQQEPETQLLHINMGGPRPSVSYTSGNSYEIRNGNFQSPQALPGTFTPAIPNAVWNPGAGMANPAASPAIWNTAQQEAYPIQRVNSQETEGEGWRDQMEQIPYYMVGERALDAFGGLYNLLTGNNNLRGRHQHFIRNDGKNFGFGKDGLFMENENRVQEYEFETPDYGKRKMRADYIEKARQEIDILLKTRQKLLDEANRRTPLSAGMTERTIYHGLGFNCQDYVDTVIKKAQELARQNGESLFLD